LIQLEDLFIDKKMGASQGGAQKTKRYLNYFSFPNAGGEAVSGGTLRTSGEVLRLIRHELSF
jgi:hypothetical protein